MVEGSQVHTANRVALAQAVIPIHAAPNTWRLIPHDRL